ncbi:hypothetical protein BC832DRAFT_593410 [Gaertneriomyces semiglobifer]|nr:hypothetical protein BC832DRAFT_593410 [Gaertneriomyces semiglobifer]
MSSGEEVSFQISCQSDKKLTPEGLVGVIFYSYDDEDSWKINGVRMREGYTYLRNPMLVNTSGKRHGIHEDVFRAITGLEWQDNQHEWETGGFGIEYVAPGIGRLLYRSHFNKPREMTIRQRSMLAKALSTLKHVLKLQVLEVGDAQLDGLDAEIDSKNYKCVRVWYKDDHGACGSAAASVA